MDVGLKADIPAGVCEVAASRPGSAAPIYRIVSRRSDLVASLTERMREARRFYDITLGRIDGGSDA